MSDFVHLHLHSEYSLLDGACRIADIPAMAKEAGHSAVAITDHGVMYGAVAFFRACKAEGIKPIIGCEVYLAPRTRFDKTHESDAEYYHLILLVKNEVGYRNLIHMVSKGFTEGFYSKPRIDMELLTQHHEGLIALSACMSGYVPRHILNNNPAEAKRHAALMLELFGEDYYLELQNHGIDGQLEIIEGLKTIADELHIPMVATNDVHYLRRSDSETQAVLMCIQTNTTVDDENAMRFSSDEMYYKTTDEMERLFGHIPGAIENSVRIAEQCNFAFTFDQLYLPRFKPENGMAPEEYLRQLAVEGLQWRVERGEIEFTDEHPEKMYTDRMEYELSVIIQMGYAEYYLIVRDFVGHAKSHGIATGPGRGSGAGSLVAYLLDITEVDSIRYNLLFERFLNPERISMPDFDIDFCYFRREEVLKYVAEKYGQSHVSQIATFGTLAARAAVRDVGRALGMPYAEVDNVAKKIPQQLGIRLSDALETKALRELYESSDSIRKLLDMSAAVEGMPRHMSVHAAGVVITDRPVSDYVPLATSGDTVVTQFDMDTVAALGLLKFDFLALRYLTIIENTEVQVREFLPGFSMRDVGLDDPLTYELLSKGNTEGIFQLESPGMRRMLVTMAPRNIEDIMIAIALYRPGPMESIPRFMKARHGDEPVVYKLPILEKILRDTHGCIVYQEQVMQICCEVAGFTMGHADIVRKAMSKKKAGQIEKEREAFLAGAAERGHDLAAATEIFEEMVGFAKYAFNKSHAAAYAYTSYRTAYLKAHYPKEYMAALLTSVLGNVAKTAEYIADCSQLGIQILPPDINESRADFAVSGDNIRFGLLAIKNVGRAFVEKVMAERRNGPFKSFDSFISRMFKAGADVNKRQIESLIKAGVFDGLGVYRSCLISEYETIIDSCQSGERNNIAGQLDLFSLMAEGESSGLDYRYPDLKDYDIKTKLMLEKESAGRYFSGHLLDGYADNIKALAPVSIQAVLEVGEEDAESELTEGQKICTVGIIKKITNKKTRTGTPMAFLLLEDRYSEIELLVFPKMLEKYGKYLDLDRAVVITGSISVREDEGAKLLVQTLYPLLSDGEYAEVSDRERPGFLAMQKDEKGEQGRKAADRGNFGSSSGRAVQPQPKKTEPVPTEDLQQAAGKNMTLYLRVENMTGRTFQKVMNLIDLFPGEVPVAIRDLETGKMQRFVGCKIRPSAVVVQELKELLGDDSVVLR